MPISQVSGAAAPRALPPQAYGPKLARLQRICSATSGTDIISYQCKGRVSRVRINIPSSAPGVLSRSQAVPLSLLQASLAAHSPAGVPDPYPADPTHPSAWYTCRTGLQPAISPIPCPWHHARPTCAWRHVRSTFNLSRCLCASLCMCNTWLLHVQMGWACLDWR